MVSKAQKRATAKYDSKTYEKICLRIRNDGEITRNTIAEAATVVGESLNEFIMNAIKARLERGE